MDTETKQQRTEAELDQLKKNWVEDPCWDIETTEGFEAHTEELRLFRLKVETAEKAHRGELASRRAIQTIITRIYGNGAINVSGEDDAISKLMKEGWTIENVSVVSSVDTGGDWPIVEIHRVTTLTRNIQEK